MSATRRHHATAREAGERALRAAVAASLPRLLTLIDRAPLSPARGSADRPFWHYRADKDYPSATYAQVAWPLALLATRPALGAPESLRPRLLGLALDAMTWWASIQRADGSFDEWFPGERSQVATAFTTLGVAEAAHALGPALDQGPARGAILRALAAAARWLERNPDLDVANHAAGALAALASVEALAPGTCSDGAETAAQALLRLQDQEGFFPEYGGADPGYGTVTLAHLARAALRRPALASSLAEPLASLERFLAPFVAPDGAYGGEHGRRATRYAWLQGFALRAGSSPRAAATLGQLLAGLARGALAPPLAFDDRYFCFFALPDAVAALDALAARSQANPAGGPAGDPAEDPAEDRAEDMTEDGTEDQADGARGESALFPRAGLGVFRTGDLHLALGVGVGGALKLHALEPPLLLHDDCGYVAALDGGRLAASWSFGASGRLEAAGGSSTARFVLWSRDSPIAAHPVLLRVFFHTAGRLAGPSRRLARAGRARFTTHPASAPLTLERTVTLDGKRLTVDDRIVVEPGTVVSRLLRASAFAPVHVPSAPLWLPAFEPALGRAPADLAPLIRPGRALAVRTTVERTAAGARLHVVADGRPVEDVERAL